MCVGEGGRGYMSTVGPLKTEEGSIVEKKTG